jgi:hypothetical protein
MNRIARWWRGVQGVLFRGAGLEEPLSDKQREVVSVLEVVRIEEHVEMRRRRLTGRPAADRRLMARAFVAKAVYNDPTTVALLERLRTERNLCRICGWDHPGEVPSEATFSRAFGEFAASGLGDRVHAALVERHVRSLLVGHVSRDSTQIEARERAAKKPKKPPRRRKRGRPRKGEVVERREPPSRLPRQLGQTADEATLPATSLNGKGLHNRENVTPLRSSLDKPVRGPYSSEPTGHSGCGRVLREKTRCPSVTFRRYYMS